MMIRPKKSCLFPVTLPYQFFIQKNSYPNFFSALPTPKQHKTRIKHTFLTKKIIPPPQKKKKITDLPTLFLFRTVTGNKQIFRSNDNYNSNNDKNNNSNDNNHHRLVPYWHNRLLNVGIRIWSKLEPKLGWAEILELLFWTGIFKILAKTMRYVHVKISKS